MRTFNTFDQVDEMKPCMKKRIIVHAKQIDEPFRVDKLEGNYKQGKAGDYLMRGIEGELYICDKAIFEKTYQWETGRPKIICLCGSSRFITHFAVSIFAYLLLALVIGLAFGLRIGYTDGAKNTTELRNQMLDIKPYDASLAIKDLEYTDISSSGFTIYFNTSKTTGSTISGDDVYDLACEWVVYPSDIFTRIPIRIRVFDKPSLVAVIEKYPEGGTVMFRIIAEERNYGSRWFYIHLPRPDEGILLPPYK